MKSARAGDNSSGARIGPIEIPNKPGIFLQIPTEALKIDTEYQRPLSGGRVDSLARDWSWVACGCLTVALRGSGSGDYFVIDGQHRVEAAKRAGILELPCLVFDCMDHQSEAQGFLETNTQRHRISVLDRYRALLVTEDPIALKVQQLLQISGRTPLDGGGRISRITASGAHIVCLDFLMRAVELDSSILEKIWPLTNQICENRLLTKDLLEGMFYLERFLVNTSLTERHWSRRLLQVGYDALTKSIMETKIFEGKTGSAVRARGILRALNKGLQEKSKLSLTIEDPKGE